MNLVKRVKGKDGKGDDHANPMDIEYDMSLMWLLYLDL